MKLLPFNFENFTEVKVFCTFLFAIADMGADILYISLPNELQIKFEFRSAPLIFVEVTALGFRNLLKLKFPTPIF